MGSAFDNIKVPFWKTLNGVMAVPASWVSQDELHTFTGEVLFNEPTIKDLVDGSGFIPQAIFMEYPATAFVGLKLIVDKKLPDTEIVTIDGSEYYVRAVELTHDGANCKAFLEKVDNDYGPQNQ